SFTYFVACRTQHTCSSSAWISDAWSSEHRWDTTTGDASTQTGTLSNVTSGKSVTGNYVAQYKVSFTAAGGSILSDSTGTVVTVDGSDMGSGHVSTSVIRESRTQATFSYTSPVSSSATKQ